MAAEGTAFEQPPGTALELDVSFAIYCALETTHLLK